MLTVLRRVTGQTQGLVGQELVGAGVDGSTDGDTAIGCVSDGDSEPGWIGWVYVS